jgi:hypothetical protein
MKATRIARKKSNWTSSVELPPDLAPHPRAHAMARRTPHRAANLSAAEIRATMWQARRDVLIPETAVHANTAFSGHSCFSRPLYVDMLKQCRTCQAPFLFYANEQRFWFEVLHLPGDADCVDCAPCRKQKHRVKACQFRYAAAVNAPSLDAKAMKTFVDDTLFLFEHGLVRNLARVGAIKNRARRQLGEYSGTQRLAQAIACAREAAEMRPGAWRNRHGVA